MKSQKFSLEQRELKDNTEWVRQSGPERGRRNSHKELHIQTGRRYGCPSVSLDGIIRERLFTIVVVVGGGGGGGGGGVIGVVVVSG